MALSDRERQQALRDLREINRLYEQLGKQRLTVDVDKLGVKGAKELAKILDQAKASAQDLDEGFKGISASIREIVREWDSGFAGPTKEATNSMRKLRGFAQDLANDARDISRLSLNQLKTRDKKIKAEKARLEGIKRDLDFKIKNGKKLTKEEQALLNNLNSEYQVVEDLNKKIGVRLKKEKDIQKTLGITGQMFKGLATTLGKFGIHSETLENINEDLRETAESGSRWKVFAKGIQLTFKGIGEALKDPAVQFALLVKLMQFIKTSVTLVMQRSFAISKAFGVAGKNIDRLREKINQSSEMYYFQEELIAAQQELNNEVGVNLNFNGKNARQYQDLVLYMGYSNETAAKLYSYSVQSGIEYTKLYDTTVKQVNELNKQSGFYARQEDIMEQIANSSAATRMIFHGNHEELVKTAHIAARLGVDLNQIAMNVDVSSDLAKSIQNEAEFEIYANKQINIDALRDADLFMDPKKKAEAMEQFVRDNLSLTEGDQFMLEKAAQTIGVSVSEYEKMEEGIRNASNLKNDQLKMDQAIQSSMVEEGKNANAVDRAFQSATNNLKTALGEALGPMLIPLLVGFAEAMGALGNLLNTPTGKALLKIGGIIVGGALIWKASGTLISFLSNPLKFFGSLGSFSNPKYVYTVNESMGGGGFGGGFGRFGKLGNLMNWGGKLLATGTVIYGGYQMYKGYTEGAMESEEFAGAVGENAGLQQSQQAAQILNQQNLEIQRQLQNLQPATLDSNTMPSYAKGTEEILQDHVARVHKGERIVPARINKQLQGIANEELIPGSTIMGEFIAPGVIAVPRPLPFPAPMGFPIEPQFDNVQQVSTFIKQSESTLGVKGIEKGFKKGFDQKTKPLDNINSKVVQETKDMTYQMDGSVKAYDGLMDTAVEGNRKGMEEVDKTKMVRGEDAIQNDGGGAYGPKSGGSRSEEKRINKQSQGVLNQLIQSGMRKRELKEMTKIGGQVAASSLLPGMGVMGGGFSMFSNGGITAFSNGGVNIIGEGRYKETIIPTLQNQQVGVTAKNDSRMSVLKALQEFAQIVSQGEEFKLDSGKVEEAIVKNSSPVGTR